MTTSTVTPKTGPGSTSFAVFITGALPGLLTLLHGILTGTGSVKLSQILGGAGLTAVAAAFKLLHDSGIHKATILAAGADVADAIPQFRSDLEVVRAFIENDFPQSAGKMSELDLAFKDLQGRVTSMVPAPSLAEIVTAVKNSLLAAALPGTPAPAPTATA